MYSYKHKYIATIWKQERWAELPWKGGPSYPEKVGRVTLKGGPSYPEKVGRVTLCYVLINHNHNHNQNQSQSQSNWSQKNWHEDGIIFYPHFLICLGCGVLIYRGTKIVLFFSHFFQKKFHHIKYQKNIKKKSEKVLVMRKRCAKDLSLKWRSIWNVP